MQVDRTIVCCVNGDMIIINGVDSGFGTTDESFFCYNKPTFDSPSPFQYISVRLTRRFLLWRDEEKKRFWNEIIESDYIDGYYVDGQMYKKDKYETFSSAIDKFFSRFKHPEDLNDSINPFHIIRQPEVEKFYEYTSSIVINGIECGRYVDAGVGYFGYHDNYPEYVEIEGDKYDDVIATIPQDDLKLITIGNVKDGLYTKYIIPKKYIDKIILRRKYLHTDCIEFSLEKFYTGEEDVFELDPKNPDPEVLEMMKEYRVIQVLE